MHERIDYSDQNGLNRQQRIFEKFRVQLPFIVLTTIGIQLACEFLYLGSDAVSVTSENSIWFTSAANIAALLAYKRMRLYPGARRLGFLLPSFLVTYAIGSVLLLILRIPYSTLQLALGFGFGVLLSWIFNAWNRRPSAAPILLVPSTRTIELVHNLPNLNHQICESPDAILRSKATVVVDLHREIEPEWEQAIAKATLQGASIYHVKQIQESLTGKVAIEHLSENTFGSLAPDSVYFLIKKLVDSIGAALCLVALSPVLLILMGAIRLESPGPAIFRQTRIGYRGVPFQIFKLRTMRTEAASGSGREAAMTRHKDPRVTPLGRFLRETRADELPQLVNVLLGQMSLIGPRPEAVELSKWYEQTIDFYPYRHVVLPGITGWAQVNQGHVADVGQVSHKLQYDFYYIKHFSLWLDALIFCKTIGVILTRFGVR